MGLLRRDPDWARPAFVGVFALLVYATSLGNGFALDDVPAVAEDTRIRDLASVPTLVTEPYLTYMPRARSPWRPVTSVTYAISWALGGGHPVAFHATNVVLHAIASLLVLSVFGALGAPVIPAALAALIFAAHPVHVEAVAGIVGRADVLSTIFLLLAVRLQLAATVSRGVRAVGISVLYLLALASKESAVVLPLLLIVVALFAATRADGGGSDATGGSNDPGGSEHNAPWSALLSTWPIMLGLGIALVAFLTGRAAVLGSVVQLDVASYIVVLPTDLRLTTAVANLGEVARLLLFPANLSPEYGPSLIMPADLTSARFWLGASIGAGTATAVARGLLGAGRHAVPAGWLLLGAAWFAIGFALVSNLVIPMPMWIAERTLYLPSVGLSFALVGVLCAIPERKPQVKRAAYGVVVAAVLAGGIHSALHARTWKNNETLYNDLAERHPESFRAQWWVGGEFVAAGDVERGAVWLGRAVETNPNGALLTLDYARALLLLGRSAEAEALVRPIPPRAHPSRSVYLAQSLIFQDRPLEAIEAVREGLRYFPGEQRLLDQADELGMGG